MSTIRELDLKTFISLKFVEENLTYEELSKVLQQMYPGQKGFSVRSLQRYCSEESIHKTSRLSVRELNEVVQESVIQVHQYYMISYLQLHVCCIMLILHCIIRSAQYLLELYT